jgi:hypothetical protein
MRGDQLAMSDTGKVLENTKEQSKDSHSPVALEVLQKRKLELEIQDLTQKANWISWQFRIGDLVPILIATITLIVAYSTGILDAKRMELSSQKSLFQLETKIAEERAKEIQVMITTLEAELNRSRIELETQEKLRALKGQFRQIEGCNLSVDFLAVPPHVSFSIDGGEIVASQARLLLSESCHVAQGCIFDSVTLARMRLSLREIEEIVTLQPSSLTLNDNRLGNQEADLLQGLNRLKTLALKNQFVTSLDWAKRILDLTSLSVEGCQLEPGSFNKNFAFADSLESLSIGSMSIDDLDIVGCKQFSNLKSLYISKHTAVSSAALRDFAISTTCNLTAYIPNIDENDIAIKDLASLIQKLKDEGSHRLIIILDPISGTPQNHSGNDLLPVQQLR